MNVLLGLLDDTHCDAFAQMPYLWSMPDGHWTRFSKATFSNPYCGPSRVAINTGRTSKSSGVINHGISPTPTNTCQTWDTNNAENVLPVRLRAVGWRTGLTGKWSNGYPWAKGDTYVPPGFDGGGWFAQLDDFDLGTTPHNGPTFLHTPAFVNYALCENGVLQNYGTGDPFTTTGSDASGRVSLIPKYFTDKASVITQGFMDGPQPWYFNLNERATHGTIMVANRHLAAPTGGLASFSIAAATVHNRPSFNQAAGADWNTMPAWVRAKAVADQTAIDAWKTNQQDQWRCVQSVDESLRDIVTKLKALGQFDNTVIIFMSDNGWLRGEHRLEKKNVCYEGSVRTEIWIRHPDAPLTNRTSTALVQNIDVGATIMDIAKVRPPRPMNGQSFLRNVLDGSDAGWRDTAFIESYEVDDRQAPAFQGVVTSDFKYVELEAFGAHAAENELYDLTTHPDETRNVVADGAYASALADMQRRLAVLKRAAAA